MNISLLLAPLPALLGSLFLMHSVEVGPWVWGQQALVLLVCLLICGLALRKPHEPLEPLSEAARRRWALAFLVLLVIPCLGSGDGPRRWIELVGLRLYVASAILPVALLLLSSMQGAFLYVAMAAALALQPDASQVIAFSVAAGPAILMGNASKPAKGAAIAGLAACVAWVGSRPDPLEPIPHVEGVLDLAWTLGPAAAILAVVALALPIFGLAAAGVTRRPGLGIAAVYYLMICLLAGFTQWTPMPWLGFGAGPILGYFVLVSAAQGPFSQDIGIQSLQRDSVPVSGAQE